MAECAHTVSDLKLGFKSTASYLIQANLALSSNGKEQWFGRKLLCVHTIRQVIEKWV